MHVDFWWESQNVKRPLRRLKPRQEDNIKTDLIKINLELYGFD
jgi:hypothetical protein